MYIHLKRGTRPKRGKANRLRGKLKAKNRRRVNRMAGRKLGRSKAPRS